MVDADTGGKWYDVRIKNGYETDVENSVKNKKVGGTFQGIRPVSFFDPDTREWKERSFEPNRSASSKGAAMYGGCTRSNDAGVQMLPVPATWL